MPFFVEASQKDHDLDSWVVERWEWKDGEIVGSI